MKATRSSIPRLRIVLLLVMGSLALISPRDSSSQSKDLKQVLAHADSLIAYQQADQTPYHLHYDLVSTGMDGQTTNGTFDFWFVDRQHQREWITIGSYYWDWTKVGEAVTSNTAGFEPLRIMEFFWYWRRPYAVIDEMSDLQALPGMKKVKTKLDVELCAADTFSEVCVNATLGNYVRAREGALSAVYAQWRPVGNRFATTDFALFQKKKMIFHAVGTIEPMKDADTVFDQSKRTYPSPPEKDKLEPKLIHHTQSIAEAYGSALVHVWVDSHGNVTNVELMDADEKSVAGAALRTAKTCKYIPAERNGSPVPSETTYLYTTWGGL
jgi:hypothetical protein